MQKAAAVIYKQEGGKPPPEIRMDKKRKEGFLAKKLESQPAVEEDYETEEKAEKVFLVEPSIEISFEVCERKGDQNCVEFIRCEVFKQIDKTNFGLEFGCPYQRVPFYHLLHIWVDIFGPKYSISTSSHHTVAVPLTCVRK